MPYEEEIQILSELRSEYSCFDPNEREYYHALSEAIRSLKTVDAEGHGHWENYLKEGLRWKCSECGSRFETPYHYCPNCGAKMDRERKEDVVNK